MKSLIIPIYKNEENIPSLIEATQWISSQLNHDLEIVFVVDGSPDNCFQLLEERLPTANIHFQLVRLSRNFGSFAAIRAGLSVANGDYFSVMAADLQEPKELIINFFQELNTQKYDIVVASRVGRNDPFTTRISANIFWYLYRSWVQPDMPDGGVDIFGCNKVFRDELLNLKESNSSLVGLIFWLGFRRKVIHYIRQERVHGKSAWTFKKKFKYMMDSIFSFSDLPIKLLLSLGFLGIVISIILSLIIIISKLYGTINVPGYSATLLVIVFFGSLNSFGFGIIGNYIWRSFENTKRRPESIILEIIKENK